MEKQKSAQQSSPHGDVAHKSILNGFKFDAYDPVNIFSDKQVVKTFDVKAHCLEYFQEASVIIAGFSKGLISVYKEDKTTKPDNEYQLINVAKIKASSERISKIMINRKKGQVYAFAKPNRICIIDMANWTNKETVKLGSGNILCILIDENYDLGVCTTEDGKVMVLDIAGEKPVVKRSFSVTTKGRLTCLDADIDSGKIFTTCYETGEVFLIDIEFPFTAVV